MTQVIESDSMTREKPWNIPHTFNSFVYIYVKSVMHKQQPLHGFNLYSELHVSEIKNIEIFSILCTHDDVFLQENCNVKFFSKMLQLRHNSVIGVNFCIRTRIWRNTKYNRVNFYHISPTTILVIGMYE